MILAIPDWMFWVVIAMLAISVIVECAGIWSRVRLNRSIRAAAEQVRRQERQRGCA